MNCIPITRWNPLVLSLGVTLALGSGTLAQQGGSTGTPSRGTAAPASPGTAPAPTVPATNNSGTAAGAVAASPTVLCGLTGQGAGRGTAAATAPRTGGSTTGATTGSGAGETGGTSGSTGSGTGGSGGTGTGGGTTTGTGGTAGTGAGTGNSPGTTGTGAAGTGSGNASPGGTAGAPTGSNTGGVRLSATDTCFAQQATLSDLFELQSSQLAATLGGNARVKTFARQLIQDHTRSSQQLSTLAPRLGLRLPTALEGPKLAEVAALRGYQGAAFDRAFMASQVNAHEQAVNLFTAYSRSSGNAQLRAHATRTLPALQKHLQSARELLQAVVK